MAREFRFQDPGEGIHEAEISEIHVGPGDTVAEGDTVLTVETDKALTDLHSPYAGEVEEVAVAAGDVVEVGDLLITFGGEPEEAEAADRHEEQPEETGEEPEETGEEPAEDVRLAGGPAAGDRTEPVPAAPATRRLAAELGVDLQAVDGSGPEGRVTDDDVRAAAEEAGEPEEPETPPAGTDAETAEEAPAPFERWGPVERVPLRGIRRTTARRMAQSWTTIPQVTHHDLADITDLERLRREHAGDIEDGDLTLLVVVMKAVAAALGRFPRFNASLDEENQEIVLKQYVHLGLAVDTEEGLMVPVVRDVDRHSIRDLAAMVTDLVERARSRDVVRDDMAGASFTITNPGPLGGRTFTPIINPPEVAILGTGRARLETVVAGDLDDHDSEVRLVLPLSLTFDHRVVDGADAARFVTALVEMLGDPEQLILDL